MLHAGDSEVTDHALGSEFHSFLLFAGERIVSVLERGEDFVTCHRCWTCEGEDRANGSQSERRFKLVSGADHDLEADFFLAGLQFSHDGYGGR